MWWLTLSMSHAAWHASSLELATTTPFPAASPLAFTTKAGYSALQKEAFITKSLNTEKSYRVVVMIRIFWYMYYWSLKHRGLAQHRKGREEKDTLYIKEFEESATKAIAYWLMYWHASLESLKLRNLAVGMPWRDMNSLENSLLASIWAALAVGPKQGIPSQGGTERKGQNTRSGESQADISYRSQYQYWLLQYFNIVCVLISSLTVEKH